MMKLIQLVGSGTGEAGGVGVTGRLPDPVAGGAGGGEAGGCSKIAGGGVAAGGGVGDTGGAGSGVAVWVGPGELSGAATDGVGVLAADVGTAGITMNAPHPRRSPIAESLAQVGGASIARQTIASVAPIGFTASIVVTEIGKLRGAPDALASIRCQASSPGSRAMSIGG